MPDKVFPFMFSVTFPLVILSGEPAESFFTHSAFSSMVMVAVFPLAAANASSSVA